MTAFAPMGPGAFPASMEDCRSVESMRPSDKFTVASQLISQLAQLIEGPPEQFSARIGVLRDIKRAWSSDREVSVVVQDHSSGVLPVAFHAAGSMDAVNFVVKDEPDFPPQPRIDCVVGYGLHPMGTAGYADRALSTLDESGSPQTSSLETESFQQEDNMNSDWESLDDQHGEESSTASQSSDGRLNNRVTVEDAMNHGGQLNLEKFDDVQQAGSNLEVEGLYSSGDDEYGQLNGCDASRNVWDAFRNVKSDHLSRCTATTQTTGPTDPSEMDKWPTCKKCGQKFCLGAASPDRPFACPHCQLNASRQGPMLAVACVDGTDQSPIETPGNTVSAEAGSDEKRYSCKQCSKVFATKSSRNYHKKTHWELTPARVRKVLVEGSGHQLPESDASSSSNCHPCDVCDGSFPTEIALEFHKKDHHICCHTCGIPFPTKLALKQHEDGHHQREQNKPAQGSMAIRKKYKLMRMAKKTIPCPSCEKKYQTRSGLRRHLLTHTKKRQFECRYCSDVFTKVSLLRVHMCTHADRLYHCHLCSYQGSQKCNLKRHCQTVHKCEVFKCQYCKINFMELDKLRDHEQRHEYQWENLVKQRKYKSAETANLHGAPGGPSKKPRPEQRSAAAVSYVNDEKPSRDTKELGHSKGYKQKKTFVCPECHKPFTTNCNAKRHMESVHGKSRLKCLVCAKLFFSEAKLREHAAIHSTESQATSSVLTPKATLVKKKSSGPAYLNMAKMRQKKKVFPCPICPKILSRKESQIEHIRTHTNEKPHVCNECGKAFRHRAAFSAHKKTHQTPSRCAVCQEFFLTLSALNKHKQVHEERGKVGGTVKVHVPARPAELSKAANKKAHPCRYCFRVLSSRQRLLNHESLHKGNKTSFKRPIKTKGKEKFKCQHCDKVLNNRGHLVQHERVHTGERPFTCKICQRSFKAKSSLYGHEETQHGVRTPRMRVRRTKKKPIPHRASQQVATASGSPVHQAVNAERSVFQKGASVNKKRDHQLASASRSPSYQLGTAKKSRNPLSPAADHIVIRNVANSTRSSVSQVANPNTKSFQISSSNASSKYKPNSSSSVRDTTKKIIQCKVKYCGQIFISQEMLANHEKIHSYKFS